MDWISLPHIQTPFLASAQQPALHLFDVSRSAAKVEQSHDSHSKHLPFNMHTFGQEILDPIQFTRADNDFPFPRPIVAGLALIMTDAQGTQDNDVQECRDSCCGTRHSLISFAKL